MREGIGREGVLIPLLDFDVDVDFGDWVWKWIGSGWVGFDLILINFLWFVVIVISILRLFFEVWCWCFLIFWGFKFDLIWVDLERIGLDWIWCVFCGYDLVSCDWVWSSIWFWIDLWQARCWGRTGGTIRKMGSETMCLYECQKVGPPVQRSALFLTPNLPCPKTSSKRPASWQGRSQAQRDFQTHLTYAWNHIERHLWTLCFHHWIKIQRSKPWCHAKEGHKDEDTEKTTPATPWAFCRCEVPVVAFQNWTPRKSKNAWVDPKIGPAANAKS